MNIFLRIKDWWSDTETPQKDLKIARDLEEGFKHKDTTVKEKPIETTRMQTLRIWFVDGTHIQYDTLPTHDASTFAFRDFYKWWFSRPQSKYYVFSYVTGEQMFLRERIASFRYTKDANAQ